MISASEISETFYQLGRLDQRSMNWLRSKGVPVSAMCEPDPILLCRIVMTGAFFDIVNLDEDGEGAFIFLARDVLDEAADIIAWQPRYEKLLTWLGTIGAIGEADRVSPALEFEGALPVWRTPLNWLRHGRRGVVIVDPPKAAYRLEGRSLLAEDAAHGIELRNSLARPMPRILIPSLAQVAA
jgi:hypothetical protein